MKRQREWTDYEDLYLKTYYGIKTGKEIGEAVGRKVDAVHNRVRKKGYKSQGQFEYAVYFGDDYGFTGTRDHVKRELNMSDKNFKFCSTPSRLKRLNGKNYSNSPVIVNLGKWAIDEISHYESVKRLRAMEERERKMNHWRRVE